MTSATSPARAVERERYAATTAELEAADRTDEVPDEVLTDRLDRLSVELVRLRGLVAAAQGEHAAVSEHRTRQRERAALRAAVDRTRMVAVTDVHTSITVVGRAEVVGDVIVDWHVDAEPAARALARELRVAVVVRDVVEIARLARRLALRVDDQHVRRDGEDGAGLVLTGRQAAELLTELGHPTDEAAIGQWAAAPNRAPLLWPAPVHHVRGVPLWDEGALRRWARLSELCR